MHVPIITVLVVRLKRSGSFREGEEVRRLGERRVRDWARGRARVATGESGEGNGVLGG